MRWHKSAVYNVVHKTSVTFFISFSVICTGYIGYQGLRWFVVTRPAHQAEQRRIKEERIAAEQRAHDAELLTDRKSAESLHT